MIEALYNTLSEQWVLGSILFDADCILQVTDVVTPADFYHKKHERIYTALLDCYQAGNGVSIVTVSNRLKALNILEEAGGFSYLSELANAVPTASMVMHHAQIVKQRSMNRRIKAWAVNVVNTADGGIDDIRGYLGEMERGVIELAELVREKQTPDATRILSNVIAGWADNTHDKGISCPEYLNESIPYAMRGHVWLIGGYTSVGKSTVLAQLISDFGAEGAKMLVFSTEDRREDKIIKSMANLSDIPQKALLTGDVNLAKGSHDSSRIYGAAEQIKSWGLKVYDDVYTVEEMRLKAKKHKMQSGLDVVAIDFVQNLTSGGASLYERMAHAAVSLQKMAKELQITVIALSQVNNESAAGDSPIIGLKGAGELAAVADIVLWLKRAEQEKQWLNMEIRKNRPFGATGLIPMQFNGSWTRIERRVWDADSDTGNTRNPKRSKFAERFGNA